MPRTNGETPVVEDEDYAQVIKPSVSMPALTVNIEEDNEHLMMPLLNEDGERGGYPSPMKSRIGIGQRQRSVSLDNADISYHGSPLDQAEMDEVYSLPSLDHLHDEMDETAGLSSLEGSGPPSTGIPPELLGVLCNPNIEDDSPAAAALRANASIHVRKVGKLARSIHAQSVRRLVKRATMRGKSGIVRGKPPRIPPPRESDYAGPVPKDSMFVVPEEEVEDEAVSSRRSSEASVKSDYSAEHGEFIDAVTAGAMDTHEAERDHAATRIAHDIEKIPTEVLTAGKKALDAIAEHEGRWKRRKRRSKKERNKSYVKGKVINGEHELYTMSIAVMLGIRTSIGATNAKISASETKKWLSSEDFMATEKYEFSPKGGLKTPPHQLSHTFKFKDYSPLAFAYLRRMFGVNEFEFLLSVCGNANFIEFISNAKSGQFFFYSSDGKYMIKTMTNAESKFLRRILPHYFRHCAQNPNTLITKFLGMYRVKMYHLRRNVKFVVMNSVYYTDKVLQSFYDLKGSVIGREAKPNQDVKKDNDLRRGLPDSAIALPSDVRLRVREQIVADCEFMKRMKIMDYSMLIGIHHVPPRDPDHKKVPDRKGSMGFMRNRSRVDNPSFRDSFRELLRNRTVGAPPGPPHSMPTTTAGSSPKVRSKKQLAHRSAPSPSTPTQADNQSKTTEDLVSNAAAAIKTPGASSDEQSEPSAGVQFTPSVMENTEPQGSGFPDELLFYVPGLQDYEHGFDEDDDSYLEGSERHLRAGSGSTAKLDEITVQKELTIEKIYWPFHHLYDIHGYRRLNPGPCLTCRSRSCTCSAPVEDMSGWRVPAFVRPLSDRKDGGLQADMTGLDTPLTFKSHGQEIQYEGKLFYMGIIDILQQYNVRKRIEARYRQVHGAGWQGASCVHPDLYADRFIQFFDEYSQRQLAVSHHGRLGEGEEQVDFETEPADGNKEDHAKQD